MGLTIDHWPPERIPKNKEVPNSGASERNHCYRFCLLKKINRKAYTNRTILFESKNIGPLLWLAFFLRSLDTCSSCFPVLAEKDATAAMDDSRVNGLPRQSWKRDRQTSLHRVKYTLTSPSMPRGIAKNVNLFRIRTTYGVSANPLVPYSH